MGLTRSKIAYNLEESPHRLTVPYKGFALVYVFSSDLYKRKFYDRFADHREEIGASLTRRFGFRINHDVISDLRLYATIEKRGFLVIKDGEKIACQDNIILDGENLMKINSGAR